MRFSIVIPTFNHFEDCLRPCIDSILKYTDLSDGEIIVSCNGCTDGTRQYLEFLPHEAHIKIVWSDNSTGYTKATNDGIAVSSGDYVILLNNDTVFLEQKKNTCIDMLLTPFCDEKVGITGPMMAYSPEAQEDFLIFFCVAIRRCLFDEFGLLDEIFSPGFGEDSVTGDTPIIVRKNGMVEIVAIEDVHGLNSDGIREVSDMEVLTRSGWSRLKYTYQHTVAKKIYRIRTSSGRISITGDHSLFSGGKEVSVKDLKVGDKVDMYDLENVNYDQKIVVNANKRCALNVRKDKPFIHNIRILDGVDGTRKQKIIKPPKKDDGTILSIEDVTNLYSTDGYTQVYDVTTEDGTFVAGVGGFIAHNTSFCITAARAGWKLVMVPNTDTTYSQPNFMIGQMPIYHKGEGTFSNWPGGEDLLRRNREILCRKFRKNNTAVTKVLLEDSSQKPLKLNIGAGNQKIEGWKSVDLYADADYKLDAKKLEGIQDGSVDQIMSIHMIEHISPFDVGPMFREWYRVLKPGGKVIIECPDILALCTEFVNADKGTRYHLLNCVYGTGTLGQPTFTPHLYGWYEEILVEHLVGAGFKQAVKREPQFYHWGTNLRIEVVREADYPEGFFSEWNMQVYRKLAYGVPENGQIAEIGVWLGRSISSIADLISDKHITVHAVDTFKGTPGEFSNIDAEAQRRDVKNEFLSNMNKFCISTNITLHHKTSEEAAKDVEDNTLDLVFIDAEHTYEAVLTDIKAWLPKLKTNGVMAGHDYAPPVFPGVVQAVTEVFGKVEVANDVWSIKKKKRRIFDCFPFFNELDLLDIRLHEMDSIVDYFILVEATKTHSGKNKSLYFNDNKERFKPFLHKIRHVIVDDFPEPDDASSQKNLDEAWTRERLQREAIMRGFIDVDVQDDDICIISDADEIPNAATVVQYKASDGVKCLEMKLHYYYLNLQGSMWDEVKILPYNILKTIGPCGARYQQCDKISNGGWHWSYLGKEEKIIEKIESWAHQEYNKPQFKQLEHITTAINNGVDLFDRGDKYKIVPIDESYPQYIIDNMIPLTIKGLIKYE